MENIKKIIQSKAETHKNETQLIELKKLKEDCKQAGLESIFEQLINRAYLYV